MGASFQAPCATPRQRQMETISWMGSDGLFIAHYNITLVITINNNNNNNNNWAAKRE